MHLSRVKLTNGCHETLDKKKKGQTWLLQGSAWRTDEWRSQQKHDRMMFSIVQKKKNKKINEIQRERKWNENADHRSHVNYGFNQTQSLLPILLCLTYCPEQYDWQLNSCFRCVCLEWRMFHREPLTRRQFVTCTYTVNSLKWITFPYGTEREKKNVHDSIEPAAHDLIQYRSQISCWRLCWNTQDEKPTVPPVETHRQVTTLTSNDTMNKYISLKKFSSICACCC